MCTEKCLHITNNLPQTVQAHSWAKHLTDLTRLKLNETNFDSRIIFKNNVILGVVQNKFILYEHASLCEPNHFSGNQQRGKLKIFQISALKVLLPFFRMKPFINGVHC